MQLQWIHEEILVLVPESPEGCSLPAAIKDYCTSQLQLFILFVHFQPTSVDSGQCVHNETCSMIPGCQ